MKPVTVQGSFVTENGERVEGVVGFVPEPLWVMEDGKAYATLAPVATLVDGSFKVELTPTNVGRSGRDTWHYKAITPAGIFKIAVPRGGPHYLKELIAHSAKTT